MPETNGQGLLSVLKELSSPHTHYSSDAFSGISPIKKPHKQ